ncbi:hypothetical protein AB4456_23830 [Vibrio splendidus]
MRLQTVIAFTFAWLNVGSYMVKMVDYSSNVFASLFFYNLTVTAVVFIFSSLGSSVPVAFGNTYYKLSSPKKLEEYRDELKEYYAENKPNITAKEIDYEIYKMTFDDLIKCVDSNHELNKKRGEYCYRSIKLLVFAAAPFLLSCIIFIAFNLDLTHPTKPILIEEQVLKEIFND